MEIGVAGGITSSYLLEKFPDSTLYSCDPFIGYPDKPDRDNVSALDIYLEKMNSYIDKKSLIFTREHSFNYLIELYRTGHKDFFDFIYIDGDHSTKAVMEDFLLVLPLVKKGGNCI
jgi:predicted O-methyltransferase YrrM